MGRQRTGDDRLLPERDSTSSGASSGTDGSADPPRRSSGSDGRTGADGSTSHGRSGIWDADSLGRSGDAEGSDGAPDSAGGPADRAGGLGDGTSGEQSETELADGIVEVDVDQLTDRQLEVLETAHDMGYYQYPRGANASEVAEALDICPSTLAEHLAAAQSKLLADVLGDPDA
ncbi:hypothetical protein GCM10028857_13820 [Salinarchaeum chitinilyticum]